MRTRLFLALTLVGISYTQSVKLRIYEEFEFGRNADEDGTATVDNAMNDNEDSEFEIRINSVEDEGKDETLIDGGEIGGGKGAGQVALYTCIKTRHTP